MTLGCFSVVNTKSVSGEGEQRGPESEKLKKIGFLGSPPRLSLFAPLETHIEISRSFGQN